MEAAVWEIIFETYFGHVIIHSTKNEFFIKDYFTKKYELKVDQDKKIIRIVVQDCQTSFEFYACLMKLELQSLTNNSIQFNIIDDNKESNFMEQSAKMFEELIKECLSRTTEKNQEESTELNNNYLEAIESCAKKGAFTEAKKLLCEVGIDINDTKFQHETDPWKILKITSILLSIERFETAHQILNNKKDLFDETHCDIAIFLCYHIQQYVYYRINQDAIQSFHTLTLIEDQLYNVLIKQVSIEFVFNFQVWLAHEYSYEKKFTKARELLLNALKNIGNPINKATYWLTFAEIEYYSNDYVKCIKYLGFAQYSIFTTKNIALICKYYTIRSLVIYAFNDLEGIYFCGKISKKLVERLILTNDYSTTPEKISLYERISSLYSHYEKLHIGLSTTEQNVFNPEKQKLYASYLNKNPYHQLATKTPQQRIFHYKYNAFYWADMRITNGLNLEKMIIYRFITNSSMLHSPTLNYTPDCAYILYSTFDLTKNNVIYCYIHTTSKTETEVIKLETGMKSKDKFLDHIAFLVESIHSGRNGEYLHEEYKEMAVSSGLDAEGVVSKILFQILLKPIVPYLTNLNINMLKIIAEEELQLIPFSGLFDNMNEYLINLFTIAYSLNFTFALNTEKNTRFRAEFDICSAVAVHPDIETQYELENDDNHLTEEIYKLTEIRKLTINSSNMNMKTTKTDLHTLFNKNNNHKVFHWCGHTIFNIENATQSHKYTLSGALVLQHNDEQDYNETLMYASDIAKMDLRHIPLAILNSCASFKGKQNSKSGELGIARAFIVAGVSCVIASLFTVDSNAATFFSQHLYRGILRKKTVLQAFTDAIRNMIKSKEYCDPIYWSSYKLYGDGEIKLKIITK